ncbi:MAG: DUF2147 domain-containing protein [Proteobacteria bacterium]|nr:DUF2147 domain-containing protein [Pseudomonadota bacterium]
MYFRCTKWALVAAIALLPNLGWAQQSTPVGQWKTVDDKSGEAKSILAITEEKGTLSATIKKILVGKSDGSPHICDQCQGDLKGTPMEGLRIIWDMKREGDAWNGGSILDPENGKVYNATMKLNGDGSQLEVRGYVAIFGRSQFWHRVK